MHISSSTFIVLLILSSIFTFDAAPSKCKNNTQCSVFPIACAMCLNGLGPACTTVLCCKRKCVEIPLCSINVAGGAAVSCPADSSEESKSKGN